jgi:hypothetical protein
MTKLKLVRLGSARRKTLGSDGPRVEPLIGGLYRPMT